ncbi:hypothetical protein LWC34_24345 [Kibdelosporangium philippinense]|uniref:Uncharacterized protein n=1 Tax=Kibdelosporangium philippinense TaxID=211113 RepID=A0ABS8ZH06_9PSEU|nr:hypothetical protein [Kibdelosporangium philippinense]MCE7005936.1 hypothetical protein [Kibdelosporangium philippinense]
MTVRPTLRCLRDDLLLRVPSIDVPLDEVDHPLVSKANEQFAGPIGSRERIRSIDDVVLFKVKVQRWRGAVHDVGEPSWLVAAGIRQEGSRNDFYEAFATAARASRARRNAESGVVSATQTSCQDWLANDDDFDRYRAEAAIRMVRDLRVVVRRLVCASLLDGKEHVAEIPGAVLGIVVQASDDHATYVALRIVGSIPHGLLVLTLELVPGCDKFGWYPEFAMPDRPLAPGEQVYSNCMDPLAAARLLEDAD